jgi:hypothetical protein
MHTEYCSAVAWLAVVLRLAARDPDDPAEHAAAEAPQAMLDRPTATNRGPCVQQSDLALLTGVL